MFISGSLTDANPGPALYALMAPALTTAGFTLVDTVTISTRTHKVWKSAAANNSQGLDWYLDIAYTTTGAGTIALSTFEMFDPGTDLGYRGPSSLASTAVDPVTFSRYGATGQALEAWVPSAAATGTQTSLTATAFGYWISITPDSAILLCSTAPSTIMFAGFYMPDPLYAAKAGSGMYPLITGSVSGSSASGSAGLTRIPPWTVIPNGGSWANGTVVTLVPTLTTYPRLSSDLVTGYPFTAIRVSITGGASADMGRWGWFRDVFVVPTVSTVVRGDTCTIDGSPYVLSTSSGDTSYAFKAV